MAQIQKLLNENTPFAVMQYFESLKSAKSQTNKKYELLYLNENKSDVAFHILNKDEINFAKKNFDKIKLIIDTKDGRIYEFNNFKAYQEENILQYGKKSAILRLLKILKSLCKN